MDPERVLWAGVLLRTVRDLLGVATHAEPRKRLLLRRTALAWFSSSDSDIGSFLWICTLLDIEPSYVLRRVRELRPAQMRYLVGPSRACPVPDLPSGALGGGPLVADVAPIDDLGCRRRRRPRRGGLTYVLPRGADTAPQHSSFKTPAGCRSSGLLVP